MAAERSTDTMQEYLQKILRVISDAKVSPDTDLSFLVNLETMILQYVRKPMQDAGMPFPPDQAQGAAQGGMPPPEMAGAAPPAGVPGVRSGINMPPTDDLQRLLSQSA